MALFKCKICGKEFERVGNGVYCSGPHYRPCPVCGKPVEFKRPSEPERCCSKECTVQRRNESMQVYHKICVECGLPFDTKRVNQKFCTRPHKTACVVCGKEFEYTYAVAAKPQACSKECREILKAQTVKQKYGVDNVAQAFGQKISFAKQQGSSYVKICPNPTEPKTSIRKCAYCGKEFEGSRNMLYCPGPHYATCEVCGVQFEIDPKVPSRCCSSECKAKLRLQTLEASNVRICRICGKEFHARSGQQLYCDDIHYIPCSVCGEIFAWSVGHADTCSDECSMRKRERTCLNRYGVPVSSQAAEVKAKLRATMNSVEVQEKIKASNLLRYGVPYASQRPEIRSKISATLKSTSVRTAYTSVMQSRYGVDYAMQSPELLAAYSATCQERYGVPYYVMTQECREAQGFTISTINKHVSSLLQTAGVPNSLEYRINKYSYDILIPDQKILVELDPTYTHNAVGNHWGKGLDTDYHLKKTQVAIDKGYRCVHIFDWDNVDKVLQLFSPKKLVYARKCKVQEIDAATAGEFESLYHLQGAVRGQQICLGLFCWGQLLEVMTFGKPRYNNKYDWELLRLCTATKYKVVGGANKLWTYFIKAHKDESVISYCDVAKFTGHVYAQLGMKLLYTTPPSKIWSKGSQKITDNLLRQRGFDQLFDTDFGKGSSNEELMLQHGWLPVYDCGQQVWIHKK